MYKVNYFCCALQSKPQFNKVERVRQLQRLQAGGRVEVFGHTIHHRRQCSTESSSSGKGQFLQPCPTLESVSTFACIKCTGGGCLWFHLLGTSTPTDREPLMCDVLLLVQLQLRLPGQTYNEDQLFLNRSIETEYVIFISI